MICFSPIWSGKVPLRLAGGSCRLAGWPADWLAAWSAGRLAARPAGWRASRLASWLTCWLAGWVVAGRRIAQELVLALKNWSPNEAISLQIATFWRPRHAGQKFLKGPKARRAKVFPGPRHGGQSFSQPAGKPASWPPEGQPARQPARQPAGRPAGQPGNQPTSQPASQPTSPPASQGLLTSVNSFYPLSGHLIGRSHIYIYIYNVYQFHTDYCSELLVAV